MNTQQLHIIDKVHVKVKVESESEGRFLKDNMGTWIKDKILPYIENYIASLEDKIDGRIIQMDRLKVSLDLKSGGFRLDGIPDHLLKDMDAQLKILSNVIDNIEQVDDGHKVVTIVDSADRDVKSLFYFLATGRCPWYITAPVLDTLLEEQNLITLFIKQAPSFYETFIQLLRNKRTRLRMIRQFSDKMLYKMIGASFYKGMRSEPHSFILDQIWKHFSLSQKETFWFAVIELLLKINEGANNNLELWRPVFQFLEFISITEVTHLKDRKQRQEIFFTAIELMTNKKIPSAIRKEVLIGKESPEFKKAEDWLDKEDQSDVIGTLEIEHPSKEFEEDKMEQEILLKEGIIVQNAGLILLHPFLKNFLLKVKLIDAENQLADPFLMAHVLHYVATGKEQVWDHNLLFEKFICNIPLATSIPRDISIPEVIKQEVEVLLQAVLQNWEVLSNSSPNLLRHEYLQRSGKLNVDNLSIRLNVEHKTQDILLERLPWNISIVKLPWHRLLIYTTW